MMKCKQKMEILSHKAMGNRHIIHLKGVNCYSISETVHELAYNWANDHCQTVLFIQFPVDFYDVD